MGDTGISWTDKTWNAVRGCSRVVMLLAPRHTFQILTKRASRMRAYMTNPTLYDRVLRAAGEFRDKRPELNQIAIDNPTTCPKPWIWLGVSVESQAAADERIPELLRTPAAVRFLSCEPLLGPVTIARWMRKNSQAPDVWMPPLDWVIAGCESGPGARACDVAWLRSLRDQAKAADVAFFLKQAVEEGRVTAQAGSKRKPGGVIELPYLDGVQHAELPPRPERVSDHPPTWNQRPPRRSALPSIPRGVSDT